MAEQRDLLSSIREAVALLDDDALSALANKGLLRRAYKDLETIVPGLLEGAGVRLDAGEAVVTLVLPLTASRCSCAASGICRHILLAVLWLKQQASATADVPAQPDPGEEIRALADEALQRWAGKPLWRRALEHLRRGAPLTWEEGRTLTFTLPEEECVCHWVPGQGLAGMLCDCHSAQSCLHKVMAVLAYRAAHGLRELTADTASMSDEDGERDDVLQAMGAALAELVGHGLSHLSAASRERMAALAISAHGVELPRLERMLHTLASEIELQLGRDARADTGNLLACAAQLEAMRLALRHPTPELLGRQRSEYRKVKQVELQGMGAARWRTKSGYQGLTVYFWNPQDAEWLTWSDARPEDSPDGFSPSKRFTTAGPWKGCGTPEKVCRQHLYLRDAARSAAGRLSSREETTAEIAATGADGPTPITAWEEIAERAIKLFSAGLGERDERDALLYLEPAKWAKPTFDEVRQELLAPLQDSRGHTLLLALPYSEEAANSMALLEQFTWAPGTRVLGSLRFRDGGVSLEPLVLHQGKKTVLLTLDPSPRDADIFRTIKSWFNLGKTPAIPVTAPTVLGGLLQAALAEVEVLAEGGVCARGDLTHLDELTARCAGAGLTHAVTKLRQLSAGLAAMRHTLTPDTTGTAQSLLHTIFILRRMRTLETLLQATAGLR